MLNLRFTAGVGVGISGACELPLAWRAHKPLPWALRSSAALARRPSPGAQIPAFLRFPAALRLYRLLHFAPIF